MKKLASVIVAAFLAAFLSGCITADSNPKLKKPPVQYSGPVQNPTK